MRRLSASRVVLLSAALAGLLIAIPGEGVDAQSAPPAEGEVIPEHHYVGVVSCARRCHARDQTGNQLQHWEESAHAHAYESLASPEALQFAAERGIENPQESGECLRCHTTAWGVPDQYLGDRFDRTQGVQCESCHGPGDDYKAREVHAENREAGIAAGLIIPEESLCLGCHNEESPTFQPFNFEERAAEIAHHIPEAEEGATEEGGGGE